MIKLTLSSSQYWFPAKARLVWPLSEWDLLEPLLPSEWHRQTPGVRSSFLWKPRGRRLELRWAHSSTGDGREPSDLQGWTSLCLSSVQRDLVSIHRSHARVTLILNRWWWKVQTLARGLGWVLAHPLAAFVALSQLFNLMKPQFLPCKVGIQIMPISRAVVRIQWENVCVARLTARSTWKS